MPFMGSLFRWGRRAAQAALPAIPVVGPALSRASTAIGTLARRHPTITAVGSAAAGGVASAGAARMFEPSDRGLMQGRPGMGRGGMLPGGGALLRGYHMSKPYKCHGVIVPSHLVRNRHMRATNPRALRRAIRRAKGFERLARKVMHFVSPRAHKGRAVFKTRRRAR